MNAKRFLFIMLIALMAYLYAAPKCTAYAEEAKITVTAENTGSSVNRLSWTKTEGAESYVIYSLDEETGKYKKLSKIKGTACSINNLTPNTKYTYKIGARLADGKIGAISEPVSLYTRNKIGSSLTAPGNITGQGEWIYFITDNTPPGAGIYKIKKDGSGLTLIKRGRGLNSLNVAGDKIYYINSECDRVVSCDLYGKNECVELDIRKCLDDYDDYSLCHILSLIVADEQIYCSIEIQQSYDDDFVYAWYKFDPDNKKLSCIFPDVMSIIDIDNSNITTIENSLYTIPDSQGKDYICKYDISKEKRKGYSIYIPENAVRIKYSDLEINQSGYIPYTAFDMQTHEYIYCLCDIDSGEYFLIKDADSIYKYNDIVFCTVNGEIIEYKAGEEAKKYGAVNDCNRICYADKDCIVLYKCDEYKFYIANEYEYTVIDRNTGERTML